MKVLALDIGGTNLRAAVVSDEGTVCAHERVPHGGADANDLALRAAQSLLRLARQENVEAGASVGVAVAGQLHGEVVAMAPNLKWRDVPFGKLLSSQTGRRVKLVNDLSAAAWGEFSAGASKGHRHVLTVFVGSGVGSAIIADGKLLEGATGVAAELGHIKVERDGRLCGCGERGCLEAYAGGHNLEGWMRETGILGTPADLERAALGGNGDARRIYDFASDALGLAVANQVTVLNPSMVVLGGGVLMNCPEMLSRVRISIGRFASRHAGDAARVSTAALGDDSGLIGAGLLAL